MRYDDIPEDSSDFEGNEKKEVCKVQAYDETGKPLVDIVDVDKSQGFCPRTDLRKESPKYDEKLWNELIRIGQEIEKGTTGTSHEFPLEYEINGVKKTELDFADLHGNIKFKNNPMIEAIIKTLEYYGASENQIHQLRHDFYIARYRIFDALGMYYTGALWAKGRLFDCIEKMVKLYVLQKNVGGFCWWLRGHDLDVEEPRYCKDCIKSYENWTKEIPKGRTMNDFT